MKRDINPLSSKIRVVLFDLGNTLLYFDGTWPDVFTRSDQELVTELLVSGYVLDRESFTKEFRKRLEEYYVQREAEFIEHTTAYVLKGLLCELGYEDIDESRLQPALEKMYAVSQTHWKLEDDTLQCLEALKEQDVRLAVVSNAGDDGDVQTLIDNNNLRGYFDFVLSSAACGIRKPNPQIFEIALEKLMVSADAALMVGDKLGADILGAKNANIFSVWNTRRADTPGNRNHADTIEPDAKIASLGELPELVSNLLKYY